MGKKSIADRVRSMMSRRKMNFKTKDQKEELRMETEMGSGFTELARPGYDVGEAIVMRRIR